MKEEAPEGTFVPIVCDLQEFDSVRKAIEEIKAGYKTLDVLCNNAGVMALEDYATKDGYDVGGTIGGLIFRRIKTSLPEKKIMRVRGYSTGDISGCRRVGEFIGSALPK